MRLLFIILMALQTACTTMSLQYKAEVQTDKGTSQYTYTKSYKTTGTAVACGITGVIYGGWCWAYFGKPYSNESAQIAQDAVAELHQRYGINNFKIKSERVERMNWDWTTQQSELVQPNKVDAPLTAK